MNVITPIKLLFQIWCNDINTYNNVDQHCMKASYILNYGGIQLYYAI